MATQKEVCGMEQNSSPNMAEYVDIQLPSGGKVYADFKGAAVRMLKGKDEQAVSSFNIANFERKFRDLLRSGVLIGVDADELTIGDRFFLAIYLARSCYSNILNLDGVMCPHCLKQMTLPIDMNAFEKISLPDGFKEPIQVTLSNGDVVPMRLMRVKDRILYSDKVISKGEELPLYRISLTMADDKSIADRLRYLEELPAKDVRALSAVQDANFHGFKLHGHQVACPGCGGAFPVDVPFQLGIFFPEHNTVSASVSDSV